MSTLAFFKPASQWWNNRDKLNDNDFERLNLDFQPAALSIQNRPLILLVN